MSDETKGVALYIAILVVAFSLACGICADFGAKGTAWSCGFIAVMGISVLIGIYLDSGPKFQDVDKRRQESMITRHGYGG